VFGPRTMVRSRCTMVRGPRHTVRSSRSAARGTVQHGARRFPQEDRRVRVGATGLQRGARALQQRARPLRAGAPRFHRGARASRKFSRLCAAVQCRCTTRTCFPGRCRTVASPRTPFRRGARASRKFPRPCAAMQRRCTTVQSSPQSRPGSARRARRLPRPGSAFPAGAGRSHHRAPPSHHGARPSHHSARPSRKFPRPCTAMQRRRTTVQTPPQSRAASTSRARRSPQPGSAFPNGARRVHHRAPRSHDGARPSRKFLQPCAVVRRFCIACAALPAIRHACSPTSHAEGYPIPARS
jgi:hypothetical protein